MLAAMLNTVRMEVIFTTDKNLIEIHSLLLLETLHHDAGFVPWWITTISSFILYTHLFRSTLFPFGNSVISYVWFSYKESISSCMTLNHLRLRESISSSKLFDSPSSVISTCSSFGNMRGALLSLRGYLLSAFDVGSSCSSSSVGSLSLSGFWFYFG